MTLRKRDVEMLALGATLNQAPAQKTEYVTREVHEHRAPTDDSIRIAKEYEEKIWKEVTHRVLQDIPSIEANYIVTEESCYDRSRHIFFKVNGREIRHKIEYLGDIDQLTIYRHIADEITKQLMSLLTRHL